MPPKKKAKGVSDRAQIVEKILQVVGEYPDGILISSFWNVFRDKFNDFPDPTDFGFTKRSELLSMCSGLKYIGAGSVKKVALIAPIGENSARGTSVGKEELTLGSLSLESQQKSGAGKEAGARGWSQTTGRPPASLLQTPHAPAPAMVPPPTPPGILVGGYAGQDHWPSPGESPALHSPAYAGQSQPAPRQHQQSRGFYDNYAKSGNEWKEVDHMREQQYRHAQEQQQQQYMQHQRFRDQRQQQQQQKQQHHQPHHHHQQQQYHHQQQQQQQQHNKKPAQHVRFIEKSQLETVALDCIERLTDAKECVTIERVEKMILQHYSVDSLDAIGCRKIEHIQCVFQMLRKQCKVNAYIQAFTKVRSVATLHELHEALRSFCCEEGKEFESLLLGPFVKQPMVYEFFQAPTDLEEIPEITTDDVLTYLRDFLTKTNTWTSQSHKLEDFMQFIMEQRGEDSPYKLGIRLRSMPLLISVLKRAQRDTGNAVRAAMATTRESIQSDIRAAVRSLTTAILDKDIPGLCTVRKTYLNKSFINVLDEFYFKGMLVLDSVISVEEMCGTNVNTRRNLKQHRTIFSQFVAAVRKDEVFQQLLYLAICCHQEEIHRQIGDVMAWLKGVVEVSSDDDSLDDIYNTDSDSSVEEVAAVKKKPKQAAKPKPAKKRPPLTEIMSGVKKYLERCIAHGSLTLKTLARIEGKILEDYKDFPNFPALGQGSFLDFLLEVEDIKKMIEESGGSLLGTAGTGTSALGPDASDVADFVHQCGVSDVAQSHVVESALSQHYSVADIRFIGHGSANAIVQKHASRPRNKEHVMFYESALCSRGSPWRGEREVGVLGHQSKHSALACLQNCPLLADMGEWAQWEHVFQPEMGKLKDFVQKHGGVHNMTITEQGERLTFSTSILALETRPGTLLKLTCQTAPEKFASAAMTGDVTATCGHLGSLVAINKGHENTPTALLANHMKTALLTMQANGERGRIQEQHIPGAPSGAQTGEDGTKTAVNFVLDCLITLPVVMCQTLASQVFVEPLSSVVGASKSKTLLLNAAGTSRSGHSQVSAESRLQLLGAMLGIGEWAASFQARTHLPRTCLQRPDTCDDGMGGVIEVTYSDNEDSDDDIQEVKDDDDDDVVALDSGDDVMVLSDDDNSATSKNTKTKVEAKSQVPAEVVSLDSQSGGTIELGEDTEDTMDTDDNEPARKTDRQKEGEEEKVEDEEKEEEEAVDKETSCKAVIDLIRREEFGVDVQLSEDGEKLMKKQQERLGRSLDRLSKDLYSKDTHFVLELIQNADDNDYPQDMLTGENGCPSVKFVVTSESIQVLNNECGFTEKNIRAICDVGRSTKGKHKFGYIGQKGIGFKSVFRITDAPEVHSNGYHINFDVTSGPMGYILPHWIEDQLAQGNPAGVDKWKTRIVLPLKGDLREQQQQSAQTLAARFQDVHPSLLLFLHRLRCLTVVNKAEDYVLRLQRRDVGERVVEIHYGGNVDRFLVVRHALDATRISLQAKAGVDVEATEMALAFPLPSSSVNGQQRGSDQVIAEKQPVFAFLPLRSYGFRFIVQADFDVPSSREDVDKDSIWNQWLRGEIHHVFIMALQAFKDHAEFNDSVQALCTFLQYIPLEDEILDFFRPVASNILRQLRASPCLPTQATGKNNAGIQWKMPSQLVLTRDALMRDVINGRLLQTELSLDYLHPTVAAAINPSLMKALDIQTLGTEHLLSMANSVLKGLDSQDEEVRQSALFTLTKWLACVYRSLDDMQENDAILDRLRSLPIIPLADGRTLRIAENTVFFPLDRGDDDGGKHRKKDPLFYLEQDLSMVQLLPTDNGVVNSQVEKLLEMLGVKHLTPHDITRHHIIPTLKGDTWKEKSRDILLSYVVFLKDQFTQQADFLDMDELRPLLVVWTNHGLKKPAMEAVHFTPAYRNKINLTEEFPGYDWPLLDAVYLQGATAGHVTQQWRDFFEKIGVIDFLAVEHVTVKIKQKDLALSEWSPYVELLPPMSEYIIKDVVCSELTSLICKNKHMPSLQDQMKHLFQWLDQLWAGHFSRYTTTQVCNEQNQPVKEVETSFAMSLKKLAWIPAMSHSIEDGDMGEKPEVTKLPELRRGCEIFRYDAVISQLLAVYVPYLTPNMSCQDFAAFLGINTSISVDFVKNKLIEWSTKVDGQKRKGVGCFTLNHISTVYKYLAESLPPKQLQDLFNDHSVIFVLEHPPDNPGEPRKGVFRGRKEVRWADTTGLFMMHRGLLQSHSMEDAVKPSLAMLYPELHQMFVHNVRVQLEPDLDEYAKLWRLIATVIPLPRALPDTLRLMGVLGQGLSAPSLEERTSTQSQLDRIKSKFAEEEIIPVKGLKWVKLSDQPMIADDKQLERMFAAKENVTFVDLGDKMFNKPRGGKYNDSAPDKLPVIALLTYLGVPGLKDSVQLIAATESYRPCPELQKYVHDVLPWVQQLLLSEHDEVYAEWSKHGLAAKIGSMLFGQVGKLELVHSLKQRPDVVVVTNESCQMTDDTFNVHHDKITSYHDINRELARFFSRGDTVCFKELRSFLVELLPIIQNPSSELDQLKSNYNLSSLPDGEEAWTVPEPVIYQPKPPTPQPIYAEAMQVDEAATSDRRHEDDGKMRAWPPRAPADKPAGPFRPRAEGPTPGAQWPPPAPPPGVSLSTLPDNLRPSSFHYSVDPTSGLTKSDGSEATSDAKIIGDGKWTEGGGQPHPPGTYHTDGPPGAPSSSSSTELPPRLRIPGVGDSEQDERHHHPPAFPLHGVGGDGARASSPTPSTMSTMSTGVEYVGASGRGEMMLATPDQATFPGGEGGGMHPLSAAANAMSGQGGLKRARVESGSENVNSRQRPVIFHGNPIWTESAEDSVLFESIASGSDLVMPKDALDLDIDSGDMEKIGNWGEQLVFDYLLQEQRTPGTSIVAVKWVNQQTEIGLPYDLIVSIKDIDSTSSSAVVFEGDDVTNLRHIFIEVKATLAEGKAFFEISHPQLKFAEEKEENYHILRVYNVGKPDQVRLVRLENLAQKLKEKQVKLCMVI